MEYIYKISTTGSNNYLKLNSGQIAVLRKTPFDTNTHIGNEINTGIFSFNVINTDYYELWTGESITALTKNTTFSTSLTGKLLFGNDVIISNLTGSSSSYNFYPLILTLSAGLSSVSANSISLSSSINTLSATVNSISSNLNSISSSLSSLNTYTLTSTFVGATSYLFNLIGTGGGTPGPAGPIVLRRTDGSVYSYNSIQSALSFASSGDLIQVYKSLNDNINLKDGVNLYFDDNVIIDALDPSTSTIIDNGSQVKCSIYGNGIIQNSYDCVNSSSIRSMDAINNTIVFSNDTSIYIGSITGSNSINWSSSSLSGGLVRSIKFISPLTGYLANNLNQYYRTVNGGISWSPQNAIYDSFSSVSAGIKAVYFLNSLTGFLSTSDSDDGGGANTLLRTTNGGATWTKLFSTGISQDPYFYFVDSVTGFYAARGTSVLLYFRTVDGGITWSNPGIYVGDAQGLSFVDGTTGYHMSSGSAMKTVNGGVSWSSVSSFGAASSFAYINFPSSLTGYVYINNKFYRTVDAGTTWQLISNPYSGLGSQIGVAGMIFLDTLTGYIKGYNQIYRTVDGGYNWTQLVGPYNTSYSGTNTTIAGAVLLSNTNSEVEINANTIWANGGTDVTSFSPTIRSSARKIWLNADKVYSNYNCAFYQDTTQQSTTCLNVNVKYMWTGMITRNSVGSSVFVNHGTGYAAIDDMKAYGTGHVISHRAGELTMWVGDIQAWRNNFTNNQIYTVYTSQGTGTQILNLNFDEIRYNRGIAGESFWAVVCGQGTMNLNGRLIYSGDGNGGGADAGIGLALDGGKYIYANVNQIIGYNFGVYSNNPTRFEIQNCSISTISPAYPSTPVVVTNNNVFLRDCKLVSGASSNNACINSFGGNKTIKIINTYANSVSASTISCLLSNIVVDSNII